MSTLSAVVQQPDVWTQKVGFYSTAKKRPTVVRWRRGRANSPQDSLAVDYWVGGYSKIEPYFVMAEARKALEKLPVSKTTSANVYDYLRTVASPNSAIPSLSIGAIDSVVLYWISGPVSIEVEIGPNGPKYLWGIDEKGEEFYVEDAPEKIKTYGRRLNIEIERRLAELNPHWRSKYLAR